MEPSLKGLDAVAGWEPGRRTVMDGLDRLERADREHIYVTVVGKGRKSRCAPFPIALMRDLMNVAIGKCGRGVAGLAAAQGTDQVFLSVKTRGR